MMKKVLLIIFTTIFLVSGCSNKKVDKQPKKEIIDKTIYINEEETQFFKEYEEVIKNGNEGFEIAFSEGTIENEVYFIDYIFTFNDGVELTYQFNFSKDKQLRAFYFSHTLGENKTFFEVDNDNNKKDIQYSVYLLDILSNPELFNLSKDDAISISTNYLLSVRDVEIESEQHYGEIKVTFVNSTIIVSKI